MQVDPQVLRGFAGQVDGVASAIGRANVAGVVTTSADGMPGSTTQWAAHSVGEHFGQMVAGLAGNVNKMGQAVRGAGDKFEVADDALASTFDGLFG